MTWRLLEEDGVGAARGLATDELLARRVGGAQAPPTLRLYTYRAHCALVGRFQRLETEVDLPFCAAHDIEVNRRPTGGGAILMGPEQLGVALALRGRGDGMHGQARALMERFSAGIVRGLGVLGVAAQFRGKNDLEVDGRKIAGLGIYRDPSGGLLFHASVLLDLDVALMARALRLPGGDAAPDTAELAVLATRTTTLRAVLGRALGMTETRGRIAHGFATTFETALEAGELAAEELADLAALERAKYLTGDWLRQETAVADTTGASALRTAGGTVEARVALAGRTLKAVQIRGDFFENAAAIADLEARLRWHASDAAAVAATVAGWAKAHVVETVPPEAFAHAVAAAIEAAGGARAPYGCFVTPQTSHG